VVFDGATKAVMGGNEASKLIWGDACPLLDGASFPALTLCGARGERPAKVASGVSSSLSSSLESDSSTSSSLSVALMSVWISGAWSVDGGAEGAPPGESLRTSGSTGGDCAPAARASRADVGGVLNKSWSLERGDNSAFVTACDSPPIFGVDNEKSSSGLVGMISTSGARLTSSPSPKT
jgi:hypothetical protein